MKEVGDKAEEKKRKKGHFFRNLLIGIISVVVLIVMAVTGITLWLTPENLTKIINKEASSYLNADVKTWNARFTFWSTFPHLDISIDSIQVISRNLDGIGEKERRELPEYSDTLFTSGRLSGGINVYSLLGGNIKLKDVSITNPGLNLVAINDSINNYNIIPKSSKSGHIPELEVNKIEALNPKPIRYFSVALSCDITADISKLSLIEEKREKNAYDLVLKGDMDAVVDDVNLLTDFPFDISGKVSLDFYPMKVSLSDMAIGLGNTSGKLDLDMDLENDAKINTLKYDIGTFSVLSLLDYFPEKYLKWKDKFDLDLNLKISTRLTEPYSFSSEKLPSFEFDFEAPDGWIGLQEIKNRPLELYYSGIRGKLVFNGNDINSTYLQLTDINVGTTGMKCNGDFRIDRIFDSPELYGDLRYDVNFDKNNLLEEMLNMRMSGELKGDLKTHINVGSINELRLVDGNIEGRISMNDYKFSSGASGINAKGSGLEMSYEVGVPDFENLLSATTGKVSLKSGNAEVEIGGKKIECRNLTINGVKYAAKGNSQQASVAINADNIVYDSPIDTVHAEIYNNVLTATLTDIGELATGSNLSLKERYGSLRVNFGENNFNSNAGGFTYNATKADLKGDYTGGDFKYPFTDEVRLQQMAHSPEYIAFNTPQKLKNFLNSWRMSLAYCDKGATMYLNGFPKTIYFGGTEFKCNLDSLNVEKFSARIDNSFLRMNGSMGNFRNILASDKASVVPVKLNVDIDTLNINQLAKVYELGVIALKGEKATIPVRSTTISSSDTMTLLIPRNLKAEVKASAKEAIYTNLKFYNIGANIEVADGNADIKNVELSSDFGDAALKIKYNSGNVENMSMDLDAKIRDINLTHIYENFPSLPKMMPQVKNLTGVFSADCSGSMLLYPDMYINVPSLQANLDIRGRQLNLHQTHFIRRVTKMMFIPNDNDIHIDNLNIIGSVHDNLLEVEPFHLSFENYDLILGGLNNFNGDLYYHIGLEKDPFHLPFGINILGKYHDPDLRFGGATFKTKNAIKVTSRVENNDQVNLTKELKYYLKVFVHKAAISTTEN